MPVITLPDGSQRRYDQSVSVMQVAADIGKGLAKATLAGRSMTGWWMPPLSSPMIAISGSSPIVMRKDWR